MRNDTRDSSAGQGYTAAHEAHYGAKDLPEALELYQGILAAYPDTEEAGYSRSQIRNIVKAVVPQQELFDAEVELARAHLEQRNPP